MLLLKYWLDHPIIRQFPAAVEVGTNPVITLDLNLLEFSDSSNEPSPPHTHVRRRSGKSTTPYHLSGAPVPSNLSSFGNTQQNGGMGRWGGRVHLSGFQAMIY